MCKSNICDPLEPQWYSVAEPGFPVGGALTHWGGANLRRIHFLAKTYAKMKEVDPVGGGGHAPAAPPGSANGTPLKCALQVATFIILCKNGKFCLQNLELEPKSEDAFQIFSPATCLRAIGVEVSNLMNDFN